MRQLRILFAVLLLPVGWATAETLPNADELTAAVAQTPQPRLTSIRVVRRNIFDEDSGGSAEVVYRGVNAIHRLTREVTVLNEAGVQVGDRVSADTAEEVERNLRGLGVFSDVSARMVSTEVAGEVELIIETRDQLSVIAGASGSFVGGVGEVGFTVGERNLLGRADTLALSYTGNTDNELRGAITYNDRHFLDRHKQASYRIGRTEEGSFVGVGFARPFKTLAVQHAWKVAAERVESDIDYYDQGRSVIQVPEVRSAVLIESSWRRGRSSRLLRRGVILRLDDSDYSPAQGSQANTISVPGDRTRVSVGALFALDQRREYRKITRLDTLRYVQDLTLGTSVDIAFGLSRQDEQGGSWSVDPQVSTNFRGAFELGRDKFVALRFSGSVTFEESGQRWSTRAGLHAFNLAHGKHTLAMRLDYTVAEGGSGLPVQQTLGENNGLRGYAAREFSGRERVRLNLEDRFDPLWQLGAMDVGLLAFVDAGWIARGGETLSSPKTSAGFGLRLGSNALLGGGIVRMDVAFPHGDDSDGKPLFSVSLGQVFGFRP